MASFLRLLALSLFAAAGVAIAVWVATSVERADLEVAVVSESAEAANTAPEATSYDDRHQPPVSAPGCDHAATSSLRQASGKCMK